MRTPVNLSKRTLRSVAHQGSLIWGKGDLQRDSTLLSSAATWKTLQQALTVFGNRTLVSSVSKSGSLRHPFASNWRYVQQVPLNLRSAGAQQVPAMRTFPSRCLTRTSTTLARQSSTNISIYTRMQLRWQSSMKTSSKSSNLGSIVAMVTAGVVVCTTIFGVYTLGAPEQHQPHPGETPRPPPDMSLRGWISRAWKNAHQIYQDATDPNPEPLLPDMLPYPYRGSEYTLVLDLEDTLLHSEWTARHGWRTIKRPSLDEFLITCYQLGFEIVIFSEKEVMDSAMLLAKMDPNGVIMYRLFKGHMRYHNGELVKDLDLLNRDLSKVIIVDDNRKSFSKHPNNGLRIKPFHGDPSDQSLKRLAELLTSLRAAEMDDVREIIKTYAAVEDAGEEFARRREALIAQQLSQQQQQQQKQDDHQSPSLAKPATQRKSWWLW
eukprot:gene5526-7207_t